MNYGTMTRPTVYMSPLPQERHREKSGGWHRRLSNESEGEGVVLCG
jgi:hypothetical protein